MVSNLSEERHIRALALDAASRIIAENLGKFINLGAIRDNKQYTQMATLDLAKGFERYVREGASR